MNFENVIEVFLPDTIDEPGAQPSTVVIFECKNHGRNVEVGEIDEVRGRIQPSYGFAIKAYVVTEKGFASGSLATAKNTGIGLIRIMPDNQVTHVMYHLTLDVIEQQRREFSRRATQALQDPEYRALNESFFGFDSGHVFGSLEPMLRFGVEGV